MTGLNIKYSNRKFGFTLTEELGKLKKHIICKAVLAKKKRTAVDSTGFTVLHCYHSICNNAFCSGKS